MGMGVDCALSKGSVQPRSLSKGDKGLKVHFSCRGAARRGMAMGNRRVASPIPFTIVSTVVLPRSATSGVRIAGNGVFAVGSRDIIINCTYPKLASDLGLASCRPARNVSVPRSIRMATSMASFRVSFATAMVSSNLFRSLRRSSFSSVRSTTSDLRRLKSMSNGLTSKTTRLLDNTSACRGCLKRCMSNVSRLTRKASALSSNMATLGRGSKGLISNTSSLRGKLRRLGSTLSNRVGASSDSVPSTRAISSLRRRVGSLERRLSSISSSLTRTGSSFTSIG